MQGAKLGDTLRDQTGRSRWGCRAGAQTRRQATACDQKLRLSIVGTNLDIVRIQEKYGYRVLADISDVFVDDEHRKLAERVVEYAKNYNISIIQGN